MATQIQSAQIHGNLLRGAGAGEEAGASFHQIAADAPTKMASADRTLHCVAQPARTRPKYSNEAKPGPNRAPSETSSSREAQRGPGKEPAVRARARNQP